MVGLARDTSTNRADITGYARQRLIKPIKTADNGGSPNSLWVTDSGMTADYSLAFSLSGEQGITSSSFPVLAMYITVHHPYPPQLEESGSVLRPGIFSPMVADDETNNRIEFVLTSGSKAWRITSNRYEDSVYSSGVSPPDFGTYNTGDKGYFSGDPTDDDSFWDTLGIVTARSGNNLTMTYGVPVASRFYVPGRVYAFTCLWETRFDGEGFVVDSSHTVDSEAFLGSPYIEDDSSTLDNATDLYELLIADDTEFEIYDASVLPVACLFPSYRTAWITGGEVKYSGDSEGTIVSEQRDLSDSEIFVGLTETGALDTEKIKAFGLSSIVAPVGTENPSEEYTRFVISLESACRKWEKRTGRIYGRTEPETQSFQVRRYTDRLYLGLVQRVDSVTYYSHGDESQTIEDWDLIQAHQRDTSTYDALVHSNGEVFAPGRYEISAVWGIAKDDIDPDIERSVLRYAAALHQQAKSPVTYLPPDEFGDYPHLIPYDVWESIEREKLSDTVFPVLM